MQFRASIALFLAFAGSAQAQSRTCNANPECAALGLADDCCPTNLAGIFLDCCEDLGASCAANPGCAGLEGNCCATDDGTFLYCCFDGDAGDGGYIRDFTYFASTSGESTPGRLWAHTGGVRTTGQYPGLTNDEYTRNSDVLYDLMYLEGNIPNAGDYVTGQKKMSIDITGTTAPPCTQIILQFESVEDPMSQGAYPANRHSRYLATVPEIRDGITRIEFEFLDRPDENVPDDAVNSAVLLFSPGTTSDYTFVYHSLDSYNKCDGGDGCESSPVKSCPALYLEVQGMDMAMDAPVPPTEETNKDAPVPPTEETNMDAPVPPTEETNMEMSVAMNATTEERAAGKGSARFLQANPDCSDCANPACVGVDQCAVDTTGLTMAEPVETTTPDETTPDDTEGEPSPTLEPTVQVEVGGEETDTPPVDEPTEGGSEETSAPDSAAGSFLTTSVAGAVGSIFAIFAL